MLWRQPETSLAADKKVHYHYQIGHGLRVRVDLVVVGRAVTKAAIALEHEWHQGEWRRVVCFDNYGGTWHRDRYRPDGSHYEHHGAAFHTDDVHQGIQWATEELRSQGEQYVAAFRHLGNDT